MEDKRGKMKVFDIRYLKKTEAAREVERNNEERFKSKNSAGFGVRREKSITRTYDGKRFDNNLAEGRENSKDILTKGNRLINGRKGKHRLHMDGYEGSSDEDSIENSELLYDRKAFKSPNVIEKPLLRPSEIRSAHQDLKHRKNKRNFSKETRRELQSKRKINDQKLYDDDYEDYDDYDNDVHYDEIVRDILLSPRELWDDRRHEDRNYTESVFHLKQRISPSGRGKTLGYYPSQRRHDQKPRGKRRVNVTMDTGWDEDKSTDDSFELVRKSMKDDRRKQFKLQKSMSLDGSQLHPNDHHAMRNYGGIERSLLSPRVRRRKEMEKRKKDNEQNDEILRRILAEKEREMFFMENDDIIDTRRYLGSGLQNRSTEKNNSTMKRLMKKEHDYCYSSGDELQNNFDLNYESCDDLGMLDTPNLSPGYEDFCDILYDSDVNLLKETKQKEKIKPLDEVDAKQSIWTEGVGNNKKTQDLCYIEDMSKEAVDHGEKRQGNLRWSYENQNEKLHGNDPIRNNDGKRKMEKKELSTVIEEQGNERREKLKEQGCEGDDQKEESGQLRIDRMSYSPLQTRNDIETGSKLQKSEDDQAVRELFLGICKTTGRKQELVGKTIPQKGVTMSRSLSMFEKPSKFDDHGYKDRDGDDNDHYKSSHSNKNEEWRIAKAFSMDCGEKNYNNDARVMPDYLQTDVIPDAKIFVQKNRKYPTITFTCSNAEKMMTKGQTTRKQSRTIENKLIDDNKEKKKRQRKNEKGQKSILQSQQKKSVTKAKDEKVEKIGKKTKGNKEKKEMKEGMEGIIKNSSKIYTNVYKNEEGKDKKARSELKMKNNRAKRKEERLTTKDKEQRGNETIERVINETKDFGHENKKRKGQQEIKTIKERYDGFPIEETISDEENKIKLISSLLRKKKEAKNRKGKEEVKEKMKNSNYQHENDMTEDKGIISDEDTKKKLISNLIRRKKAATEKQTEEEKEEEKNEEEKKTEKNKNEKIDGGFEKLTKVANERMKQQSNEKMNEREEADVISEEEAKMKLLTKLIRRKKTKLNEVIREENKNEIEIKCEDAKKTKVIISDEESKKKALSNLLKKKKIARKNDKKIEGKGAKIFEWEKQGDEEQIEVNSKKMQRDNCKTAKEKSKKSTEKAISTNQEENQQKKNEMKSTINAIQLKEFKEKKLKNETKILNLKEIVNKDENMTENGDKMQLQKLVEKEEDFEKKKNLLGPLLKRKIQAKEELKKKKQLEEERQKALERLKKTIIFSDEDFESSDYDSNDEEFSDLSLMDDENEDDEDDDEDDDDDDDDDDDEDDEDDDDDDDDVDDDDVDDDDDNDNDDDDDEEENILQVKEDSDRSLDDESNFTSVDEHKRKYRDRNMNEDADAEETPEEDSFGESDEDDVDDYDNDNDDEIEDDIDIANAGEGTSEDGASEDGTSEEEASQYGTSEDGTSEDWTSEDGTGDDGADKAGTSEGETSEEEASEEEASEEEVSEDESDE